MQPDTLYITAPTVETDCGYILLLKIRREQITRWIKSIFMRSKQNEGRMISCISTYEREASGWESEQWGIGLGAVNT